MKSPAIPKSEPVDIHGFRSYAAHLVTGQFFMPRVVFTCPSGDLTFLLEAGTKRPVFSTGMANEVCSGCFRLFREADLEGECPLCRHSLFTTEDEGKRYPSFLKTKKSLGVYGLDNGGEATLASRLVLWAQQNDRCGSIINTQLWGLTLASEFVSLQTASLGLPMPVWSGSTSLKEIAHVLEPWAEHLDKMAQKLSA